LYEEIFLSRKFPSEILGKVLGLSMLPWRPRALHGQTAHVANGTVDLCANAIPFLGLILSLACAAQDIVAKLAYKLLKVFNRVRVHDNRIVAPVSDMYFRYGDPPSSGLQRHLVI
jgi:hypothetical protein